MTSSKSRTYAEAWALLPHPQSDNAIREISQRISAEFKNILEPNDLAQEWHLWLMTKPEYVHNWFYDDAGVQRFGWKSFKRDTAAIMARSARAERHKTGYEPEDDVFYGKKQLEELLPFVFHTTVLATVGTQEEIKAPVDAAKGGNHLVAVMDVRMAYQKIIVQGSQWDQVLRALFEWGMDHTEAGEYLHLSRQVVSRHKGRAFEAILQQLNGTMPMPDHEGPGARQARSNRASIATTRNQE